jgi:hypothetical protein
MRRAGAVMVRLPRHIRHEKPHLRISKITPTSPPSPRIFDKSPPHPSWPYLSHTTPITNLTFHLFPTPAIPLRITHTHTHPHIQNRPHPLLTPAIQPPPGYYTPAHPTPARPDPAGTLLVPLYILGLRHAEQSITISAHIRQTHDI